MVVPTGCPRATSTRCAPPKNVWHCAHCFALHPAGSWKSRYRAYTQVFSVPFALHGASRLRLCPSGCVAIELAFFCARVRLVRVFFSAEKCLRTINKNGRNFFLVCFPPTCIRCGQWKWKFSHGGFWNNFCIVSLCPVNVLRFVCMFTHWTAWRRSKTFPFSHRT